MWFLIVQMLHKSRPLCCSFCHVCLLFSASREYKTKTTKLNLTLFSIYLFFSVHFSFLLFNSFASSFQHPVWLPLNYFHGALHTDLRISFPEWQHPIQSSSLYMKKGLFFLHVHQIFIWAKDYFTHCFIAHHSTSSCPSPPNLQSISVFITP